ncbi:hypothetical protein BZA70DRAFT_236122 [Myxozyma melibiosi]|uniref:Exonuclease domain-containing protein n=1 Tax=Myxozyma melibiosi TaxID=54550 RepID=A0ABR1FAJ0_9ASCO
MQAGGFEFPKQKKQRREKRKSRLFPTIEVDPSSIKTKISVADIRDLTLYILGDGVAPRWLSINNRLAIAHVAVVLVPGLTPDLFGVPLEALTPVPITPAEPKFPAEFSFFRTHKFPYLWPTKAPGDSTKLHSPSVTFLNSPLTKTEKKLIGKKEHGSHDKEEMPLENLLMTPELFATCDYPLHSDTLAALHDNKPLEEGWVETAEAENESEKEVFSAELVQEKYTVLGLDCEMVLTASGSTLARVTVVDWDCKILLDELVLPDETVTDYLTRYSGITAKMLQGVTTTLTDIQAKLTKMISKDVILTGHSLENDLRALKMRHPKVIDTAVIYSHARGLPYKPGLKYLATKFLNKDIQKQTGGAGHDSAEDARTCIELVKKKLANGEQFGRTAQTTEPLLQRLARASETAHAAAVGAERGSRTGSGAIVDYGNPTQWYGTDARTIVSCRNDDEVVEGVKENIRRHDFVWSRMRELEFSRGWVRNNSKPDEDTAAKEPTEAEKAAELSRCLTNLNARLESIWTSLPPASLMIVLSGSGDPREMSRLNAQRISSMQQFKTKKWDEIDQPWTDVEQQLLYEAAKVARSGVSFLTIKPAAAAGES